MPTSLAPVVALHAVSLATPDGLPLLKNLDIAFGADRTGLVGRNGIGKSTLMRVLAGEAAQAGGTVERTGLVSLLRQAVQVDVGATVVDLLGVRHALAPLTRLADGRGSLEDATEADWTLEARLEKALAAVGLGGLALDCLLSTLSGGERTRVALAGLIVAEPDLLLLDEPTNNLDSAGREALIRVLANWKKGAVVVSHDRALLRHMDRIVELSTLGARVYGGNFDAYAAQRIEERAAAARSLDTARRDAATVVEKVAMARERQARRMARGKRSRAKGDQPKLLLDARRERSQSTQGAGSRLGERQMAAARTAVAEAEAAVERTGTIAATLPSTHFPAGRAAIVFRGVSFAHPGARHLFREFDFAITGPERVALTGPNGTGKSTFLQLVHGDLKPDAGSIDRLVPSIVLDQAVSILDPRASILDNFRRLDPAASINQAHSVLARFLFRNADALKPAGALSGGEMLRAGLACTLGGSHPPQLLMLDEPTNHLDLDSIAAVEAALRGFDGALIVASHDEAFLEAVGFDRRLAFPLDPG